MSDDTELGTPKEPLYLIPKQDGQQINLVDIRTGEIVNTTGITWEYRDQIGQVICNYIRDGETLKKISAKPGFPPLHILHLWRKHTPEFKVLLRDAELDRADFYQACAIEKSEEALDQAEQPKDINTATKNLVDTYKWAAEKDNPEKYGNKTKIIGDPDAPISFIIDTGIRREDPEPIEIPVEPTPPSPPEIPLSSLVSEEEIITNLEKEHINPEGDFIKAAIEADYRAKDKKIVEDMLKEADDSTGED